METDAPERVDLWAANLARDVVNEALARYDVYSDIYERDILIDAACVCLADKVLAAARAEARREALEEAAEAMFDVDGWTTPIDAQEAYQAIRALIEKE